MIELFEKFISSVSHGDIDIYNEFSLQHELGIFLRARLPHDKVQFERNVSFFFDTGDFIKREMDISIFTPDKTRTRLRCAIELKFPRNGQHPEQMFSFCKDILFAEQLKKSGFERAFLIVFADDPLFYAGNGDGIYGYFRQNKTLCGSVQKPTGAKDITIMLSGSYQVQWTPVVRNLKYSIIEASEG